MSLDCPSGFFTEVWKSAQTWRLGALPALLISLPGFAGAPSFVEVAADQGIGSYTQDAPTGGLQAIDYDRDGDIDLFVPQALGVADALYQNQGNGTFVDVAADVGLAQTRWHRTAIWFDFDGDADLDIALAGDCRVDPPTTTACADPNNLMLFRQEADGRFTDVTVAAGLDVVWGGRENQHRGGLAVADLDQNGYPDLYVSTWNDRPYLFMNQGDGSFAETAVAAGIGGQVLPYHQPIIHDFDGDGRLDVYQPVDFRRQNKLWINQGDGTFADQAPAAGVNYDGTDMGVDLGDFDNDGDLDLYVTNIAQGTDATYRHNALFENNSSAGQMSYDEIAVAQGVDAGYWGWGTTFFDADNDGDLDLAATNGRQNFGPKWASDPSRFFLNTGLGPVWFSDQSDSSGFNDTFVASGLVALDFDRDGDLDLAQAALTGGIRLLENTLDAADRHYLVIRPRSDETNHFVPGTVVRLTAGGRSMMRLITAGKSTLSQEPYEAWFGLGNVSSVDTVSILWPNGHSTLLEDIAVDQILTVTQRRDALFSSGFE